MKVKFNDVQKQIHPIISQINRSLKNVLVRGDYILGKEVIQFENEFSKYIGTKHAVGVSSGTDALFLALKAMGVGKGDSVIVPVFTFIATVNSVIYTGANPIFCDIDPDTYNIDPDKIELIAKKNKKVKAIMPVHLFGQCADMGRILRIAKKYKLKIVEDAAQAHGAKWFPETSDAGYGTNAGNIGTTGCFSFYPSKNLGGFGDGGMITTNDEKIYKMLKILRNCGRTSRYFHKYVGYNHRLDTVQAALLRIKLKLLDRWNKQRRLAGKEYNRVLSNISGIITPKDLSCSPHIYHAYTIQFKKTGIRDKVRELLNNNGIQTMVYYPLPLHLQPALKSLGHARGDFPVAEKLSKLVLSLPIHPYITKKEIFYVTGSIKMALNR